MKQLLGQDGTIRLGTTADPETLGPMVKVRVRAALLTKRDLRNTAQHPIGQWLVGTVEHTDDESLQGARVVVDPDLADPTSSLAAQGLARLDPQRSILGQHGDQGAASECVVVPKINVCQVPDTIEDEHALLAGVLGGAVHVSRIERVEGKTFVTVIGDSIEALACAQIMSKLNASVRLLTSNAHRLELCTRWGVKHRHIDQAGRRADQDIVIDSGTEPDSLNTAVAMTRPRGAVVVLDAHRASGADAASLSRIASSEVRVLGASRGMCRDGIGALTSGTLDPTGLVSKRVKLQDAPGCERLLNDPAVISIMVTNG